MKDNLVCFVYILSSLLMLTVPLKCDVTLKSIYCASKHAVENGTVEMNMDVIAKYYFTREKENSVWYIAENAALEWFNIPVSVEDMKFTEKLILSVATHYDRCINMSRGLLKAQCFYNLATLVIDLERGSRFVTLPEVSHESKAKFGFVYNSACLLIVHLALIAKDNFEEFNDPYLVKDKMHGYIEAIETALRMLYDFDIDVIKSRSNFISAPIVCEINERFWKEFVGNCEVRWYVNGDEKDEKAEKRTFGKDADEFRVVSVEDQYLAREDDPTLYHADRIGNTCQSKNCMKFRVQIIDGVTNDILFEEYRHVAHSSRGEVMNMLTEKAMEARFEKERKFRRGIEDLAKNTFTINYKLLQETVNVLKKGSVIEPTPFN